MTSNLSWKLVKEVALELGAAAATADKWRQRGVPAAWQIKIVMALMARGVPVAHSDFERLETTRPEREAA